MLCLLTASVPSLFAAEPAIKISLGIRDNTHVPAAERIAFPLAFRVRNVGKTKIGMDRIPDLFFAGVFHALPKTGKEQQTAVADYWRTATYDLPPGKTFDSPNYGNLLDYFPSLEDGDYTVWWTRRKLKSNVLLFTVAGGKLLPR